MALKGQRRHLARLKAMSGKNVRPDIRKALIAAGSAIKVDAQLSITGGTRTGHVYVRDGKPHQASAPGEPPASDTGQLADSIVEQEFPAELRVEVSAHAPYAADLEFGNSKILERPFMRPAAKKNRALAGKLVGTAVSITVRRGG